MEDRIFFHLQKNECVCREGKQKTIESALLGQKVIWPRFRLTGIAVKADITFEPRTTRKNAPNERQMNEKKTEMHRGKEDKRRQLSNVCIESECV